MTEKGENAPLLSPPNTDVTHEEPPPDYTSAPPPSNPGYSVTQTGGGTGYNTGVPPNYTGAPIQGYQQYQQYPSTYHPQYAGVKETHVIMTQPTAVSTIEMERLYSPSDYTAKFILLFICSTVAFFICWPISLVACCLTCAAIFQSSRNQNPNPLIIATVITIVICLIVGIPFQVYYWVWYRKDHPDHTY
ncbi:uncharacterized protein [Dysidea avara]|uniref:uncharacterized protein n=1 Tax=Dysidea avara TaxID=196820 RepID=UPI0033192685